MKAELITYKHIKRVNELLGEAAIELIKRGNRHDNSKFTPEELEPLQAMQDLVDREGQAPYGSAEYERRRQILKPMLDHHYSKNSHHPEFSFAFEQWKPVKNFEGLYEVSDLGRIKSLKRVVERKGEQGNLSVNEIIRYGYITPKGYSRIQLSKDGKPYNLMLHIIVALSWIGEKPFENSQINHKNGNKVDNRPENLEWVTPSENLIHAYDNGLRESNAKYSFVCEEYDLSTIGSEKMAKILREEFGYERISSAGIYRAAMEGGKHLDLEFLAFPLERSVEISPINGMDLFDLTEMFFDWKAASERGEESAVSLSSSKERFKISNQLHQIFINTCDNMGYKWQ